MLQVGSLLYIVGTPSAACDIQGSVMRHSSPPATAVATVCPASSAWQLHQCQRSIEPQGSKSRRQTEYRGRQRRDSSLQDACRHTGGGMSPQEPPAGLILSHGMLQMHPLCHRHATGRTCAPQASNQPQPVATGLQQDNCRASAARAQHTLAA